jgi:hypothetical protein
MSTIITINPPNHGWFQQKFYNNLGPTDITIEIDNTTFACHKSVLTLYSPVFRSLFDTKYKQDSVIKLDAVATPEIFDKFVSYLYLKKSTATLEQFVEFINLLHYYQMDDEEYPKSIILSVLDKNYNDNNLYFLYTAIVSDKIKAHMGQLMITRLCAPAIDTVLKTVTDVKILLKIISNDSHDNEMYEGIEYLFGRGRRDKFVPRTIFKWSQLHELSSTDKELIMKLIKISDIPLTDLIDVTKFDLFTETEIFTEIKNRIKRIGIIGQHRHDNKNNLQEILNSKQYKNSSRNNCVHKHLLQFESNFCSAKSYGEQEENNWDCLIVPLYEEHLNYDYNKA